MGSLENDWYDWARSRMKELLQGLKPYSPWLGTSELKLRPPKENCGMVYQFSSDVDAGGGAGDPFSFNGGGAGSGTEPPEPPSFRDGLNAAQVAAAMPRIWIGYVLAFVSFIGEGVAFIRHPDIFKAAGSDFFVPPLEMFLPVFITRVYWFVCVYQIHKILAAIPGYVHPVSPAKAVGFHFIPFFNIYWVFHWPMAIAAFINARFQRPLMRGWIIGLGILFALLWSLLEPVTGSLLLFLLTAYLAAFLKRAITIDPSQNVQI